MATPVLTLVVSPRPIPTHPDRGATRDDGPAPVPDLETAPDDDVADRVLSALAALDLWPAREVPHPPALTPARRRALAWLERHDGAQTSHLARHMGTSTATCTGFVDRMEREGLVERRRSDLDRRLVRLSLTDRGRDAARRLHDADRMRVKAVLNALDPQDGSRLLEIMTRARDRVLALST